MTDRSDLVSFSCTQQNPLPASLLPQRRWLSCSPLQRPFSSSTDPASNPLSLFSAAQPQNPSTESCYVRYLSPPPSLLIPLSPSISLSPSSLSNHSHLHNLKTPLPTLCCQAPKSQHRLVLRLQSLFSSIFLSITLYSPFSIHPCIALLSLVILTCRTPKPSPSSLSPTLRLDSTLINLNSQITSDQINKELKNPKNHIDQ